MTSRHFKSWNPVFDPHTSSSNGVRGSLVTGIQSSLRGFGNTLESAMIPVGGTRKIVWRILGPEASTRCGVNRLKDRVHFLNLCQDFQFQLLTTVHATPVRLPG